MRLLLLLVLSFPNFAKSQSYVENRNLEDDIFKQLEFELNGGKEQTQTLEQDEKIFEELVQEMNTPKSRKPDKNTETLELITDTLAKIVLPGKNSNPANVLSMISNLLNLQKRLMGEE